jgi:hypothetical protein
VTMWREAIEEEQCCFLWIKVRERERERDERDNTFRSSVYTAHALACQGRG